MLVGSTKYIPHRFLWPPPFNDIFDYWRVSHRMNVWRRGNDIRQRQKWLLLNLLRYIRLQPLLILRKPLFEPYIVFNQCETSETLTVATPGDGRKSKNGTGALLFGQNLRVGSTQQNGGSRPGGSAQTKARQFRFWTSFRSSTYHVLLFQDDDPKAYRFNLYYYVVNVRLGSVGIY